MNEISNVYILMMGWNSAIRLVSGVEEALTLPEDKMLELFWAGDGR